MARIKVHVGLLTYFVDHSKSTSGVDNSNSTKPIKRTISIVPYLRDNNGMMSSTDENDLDLMFEVQKG